MVAELDSDDDRRVLEALAARAGLDVDRDRLQLETMRAMLTSVTGPDNPAWEAQLAITRQVLAKGGISADELEALLRRAEERRRHEIRPRDDGPNAQS